MARTLNGDLSTAQAAGFPTGGYQPAIACVLTSRDGGTTYDYSFDPTVNTNKLVHIKQVEVQGNDQGVIQLSNYDRSITADLRGYYVDVGWGLNTSAGIKNAYADGAVSPRMWVTNQQEISGGAKNGDKGVYTVLQMGGVWRAVLNCQPLKISTPPYHRDERNDPNIGSPLTIAALTDKTIYGVIEYLIETELTAATGYTFTLAALGAQDDGLISSVIPFPTGGGGTLILNGETPGRFDTYAEIITQLLSFTKCKLRAKALLDFEIIYPQAADSATQTYYTTEASGHPFYEVSDIKVNEQSDNTGLPNHVEVIGSSNPGAGTYDDILGEWYDPDQWTEVTDGSFVPGTVYRIYTADGTDFTSIGSSSNTIGTIFTATGADGGGTGTGQTYTGPYMPVDKTYRDIGISVIADAAALAAALGRQLKDGTTGARLVIPMDASVELYDRIQCLDTRGY